MAFDDPLFVVGALEFQQSLSQVLDRVEPSDPKQVLLQCSDEPLCAAISFRGADECRGTCRAEELDLILEVLAHILAPVIVAELEAGGDVPGECAEAGAHALADRFQRFEAGRGGAGVNADALGRAMIHGDEHIGLPLASGYAGHIGSPHFIDPVRGDPAVMGAGTTCRTSSLMGQQAVLAHDPEHALGASYERIWCSGV